MSIFKEGDEILPLQELFMEYFSEFQKCDFCGEENKWILKIIVNPMYIYDQVKNEPELSGFTYAKKCSECIRKELDG